MAPTTKYIADGFLSDAAKLLHEFLERDCLEFSAFADVWKKHNFSFIYMGRESVTELNQFTQEIFKRTIVFLLSNSFKKQVGSVFLLYALYRNQFIEPKVPIRVEIFVFQTLKSIRKKAVEEKLRSLHYVLDFLFDEALILVACQTLMGPTVRSVAKRFEPKGCFQALFESSMKEFKKSELLEDLLSDFAHYAELRKSPQSLNACDEIRKFMNVDQQHLERSDTQSEVNTESAVDSDNRIGSRRVELKAKAAQFGEGEIYPDPKNSIYSKCTTVPEKVEKAPRASKIGRPKKIKIEDDSKQEKLEESDDMLVELFKSKLPKPSMRRPHEKPHRIRRYYKEIASPAHRSFPDPPVVQQFVGHPVETDSPAVSEDELVF